MVVAVNVSDSHNEISSAKVLGAAFVMQFLLRYSFADTTILYFSGTLATWSPLYLRAVLTASRSARFLHLLGGKKITHPSCAWHDAAGVCVDYRNRSGLYHMTDGGAY